MAKILLVEDDVELAQTVADWLTFEKHSVEVAHSGSHGWELARANQYDLLMLDWDLPELNGINILMRFRHAGGKAPVIMVTGHSSVSDKEFALDSGADDYLTKPFDYKELSARIRALIRRAASQAPVYQALGTNNQAVLKQANLSGTSLAAHYEFLEVVGEGSAGIVFKARHPRLKKLMAIKMLHLPGVKDGLADRFEQEAMLISRLEHPGIATVHDFGVTERGQLYMVLEFVEGKNIEQELDENGYLLLERVLDVLIQVCDAMEHAHSQGVLHRDLKSSNIMIKEVAGHGPVAKILDFGCGKLRDLSSEQAIIHTAQGKVFGSPAYISPEQVRGKPADERSDIYSLGCVLYESTTGILPFIDVNVNEVMLKHLTEQAKPLRELRPDLDLPESIEPVIKKVLDKAPENRYQSMLALKEDLKRIRWNLKMSAGIPSPLARLWSFAWRRR